MKTFEVVDGWVKVPLKTAVYSLQTVYSAGYVFMDRAWLYLEPDGVDGLAVWLKPKTEGQSPATTGLEFSQELLNYAHYFTSLKANSEAVKLVLQRALFSAVPDLAKEAEEKEIQDLIRELEQEEVKDKPAKPQSKGKPKAGKASGAKK